MAGTVLAVASARVSDLHCSPFAGQEAVPSSCWGYDGPAGPHPTVGEGADAVEQGLRKQDLLKTGIRMHTAGEAVGVTQPAASAQAPKRRNFS